ncbi:hypothetical protein BDK51DRAFT_48084 [Blyttiomyces helicus]|uniref:Uncharacterized protein n=1 Tax=Blyttiomyces helicus TaxID=388810 RepID=A0A4P9WN02_9FUNG|nr:hypothetical protein BDK51DRAFT_48084 [Blyttiomyces helicus]|eukprot:RKO94459.1 hypothetical protein BDK51DRAFT_48084 [Blyttiomyces helicus]
MRATGHPKDVSGQVRLIIKSSSAAGIGRTPGESVDSVTGPLPTSVNTTRLFINRTTTKTNRVSISNPAIEPKVLSTVNKDITINVYTTTNDVIIEQSILSNVNVEARPGTSSAQIITGTVITHSIVTGDREVINSRSSIQQDVRPVSWTPTRPIKSSATTIGSMSAPSTRSSTSPAQSTIEPSPG